MQIISKLIPKTRSTQGNPWYIIRMRTLRRKVIQGPMALTLLLVFFTSQAFSCCLVNQKLSHFISSWLRFHSSVQTAEHSCCTKQSKANTASQPIQNNSKHQDCCIQDANQRLPPMPSLATDIPALPTVIIAHVTALIQIDSAYAFLPHPLLVSRPPLYITQLQILI